MNDKTPIRALLICTADYNTNHINALARTASRPITLQIFHWQGEEYDYPIDTIDVVMLDLGGLVSLDVDPELLSDTLFTRVPTILLAASSFGESALQGIRAGAMDWLIHGHMEIRPFSNVLEMAMTAYSRQRELIVSHARYRDVVEDQSEYICRFLPDFTITFANKSYTAYVNQSSAMLEGVSLLDITPVQERDIFREKIATLSPESPVASYDRKVVIDGDVYWQHWSDKAFFDSNGALMEVQSIGLDVTERRSAEQEARDSSARFQSLFKHAPVMMCELDRRGFVVNVNDKCVEVLGYTSGGFVGQHGYCFTDRASRKAVSECLPQLKRDGWVRDIPCTLLTNNGRCVPAIFSATAQVDSTNTIIGLLVVLVPVNT